MEFVFKKSTKKMWSELKTEGQKLPSTPRKERMYGKNKGKWKLKKTNMSHRKYS